VPPELIHVVGYATGAALYAMLLALAVRDRSGDRITLATAVLGLSWNVGEIGVLSLRALDVGAEWVSAASFASLGFLAAVVVHSARRGTDLDAGPRARAVRPLVFVAYAAAAVAAAMHFWAVLSGDAVPSSTALVLLTASLLALSPILLMTTRRQTNGRRAMWMTGLAVFAVSALHLGNFHGPRETWLAELLGHHASIPLAFAILYQDYRFAFADLFLKQALTLLAAVSIIFAAWSAIGPVVSVAPTSRTTGALLALWAISLLMFPALRNAIGRFVDRVLLGRANYAVFVEQLQAQVQGYSSERDVLERTCDALAPALTASRVRWEHRDDASRVVAGDRQVVVRTTAAPYPVLIIEQLAGGRRLLSDDLSMMERVAFVLARRIDAIRLTDERYDLMLREREIHALATEAELKALRAQINPHFLFNALTTIGYLIQTTPPRALTTLMRLTTLLRSVLRSDGEFTTLARERELILSYLAIERERFEERLEFQIDMPSELDNVLLPSLILQPLVENAVKHGIAPARDGGRIVVSAAADGVRGDVCITVTNTGAPFVGRQPVDDGGVGLQNVERRLLSHYGDRASLTVSRASGGETRAELRLPRTDAQGTDDAVVTKLRRRAG
jgi:hypothetical protein